MIRIHRRLTEFQDMGGAPYGSQRTAHCWSDELCAEQALLILAHSTPLSAHIGGHAPVSKPPSSTLLGITPPSTPQQVQQQISNRRGSGSCTHTARAAQRVDGRFHAVGCHADVALQRSTGTSQYACKGRYYSIRRMPQGSHVRGPLIWARVAAMTMRTFQSI
eukprot:210987-Amphidinium_carterae.2